jgi:hypothetical protein
LRQANVGGSANPDGALAGPAGYRLATSTPTSGYTAIADTAIRRA